jgi:hypothetical protein
MTETGISHSTPPVLTTIPIAVIPIIDAWHGIVITIPANDENRSRSRWNRCSCSPGIGVHDALETAFTVGRNMRDCQMRVTPNRF